MSHYDNNLDKNNANFVPLTPLSFLERAKDIYPDYEALIYEDRKYTWNEVYKRCVKFSSALKKIGIKKGDTVSFKDVLAVSNNTQNTIGSPLVNGAVVEAKILDQIRDKKVIVLKKRKRHLQS